MTFHADHPGRFAIEVHRSEDLHGRAEKALAYVEVLPRMTPRRVVVLAAASMLTAARAEAHAFGARYDLPLPLGFCLAAACMAVGASFLGALTFLNSGRTRSLHVELELPG